VREGTHTAKSGGITVAEAGKAWLERGMEDGLEQTTLGSIANIWTFTTAPISAG